MTVEDVGYLEIATTVVENMVKKNHSRFPIAVLLTTLINGMFVILILRLQF
jgi:hypothetical protein